jgi:hypothetical protein
VKKGVYLNIKKKKNNRERNTPVERTEFLCPGVLFPVISLADYDIALTTKKKRFKSTETL